ncbi:hypothetical protein B0H17DRAFT_1023188 [Mycena rosella]|uniref:Uncharacterized protein n=1 Tax=Mycena rosella TaxID=1033263 RepID=A0AAD7C670_MYCRO|nr:hypothetical protein B0H17DRAFT_1023188 [Mycena rosella]
MRVADSNKARQKTNDTPSEDERLHEDEDPPVDSDHHWSCSSSVKWTTSKALQDEMKNGRVYAKFDVKLRKFLADELSEHFGNTIGSFTVPFFLPFFPGSRVWLGFWPEFFPFSTQRCKKG